MKLFVISKVSELLLNEIIRAPDKLVIAPIQLEEHFLQLGIQIIPIPVKETNTEERDRLFYEAAMPGVFGDTTFDTTDLPAWKVLGIDRLRFWYYPHGKLLTDLIDLIEFDELVISFDIHNPIPWIASEHVGKCTAVKVDSVLTRQHLDFLKYYDKIHTLILSYDTERQFLLSQKIKVKKIVSYGFEYPARPRPADLREKSIGVYYDSRFDWKFLSLIRQLNIGERTLVIGMPDNHEWRKFLKTFPNITKHEQIEVQDLVGLHRCEEILLPHYDENVVRQVPENIKIGYYDIANTEKAYLFSEL